MNEEGYAQVDLAGMTGAGCLAMAYLPPILFLALPGGDLGTAVAFMFYAGFVSPFFLLSAVLCGLATFIYRSPMRGASLLLGILGLPLWWVLTFA